MDLSEFKTRKKAVSTPEGEIAYVDVGEGPVALFVHGVFMNGYLWRNVMAQLRDESRCIALDLPVHGDTHITSKDLSLGAHAEILARVCDALEIDRVDLVGNDTGGVICQLFAVRYPDRLRTLTLTNCDAHDNLPPPAFKQAVDLAVAGELAPILAKMNEDLEFARSDLGLGSSYEHPGNISDDTIRFFLGRFATPEGGREIEQRITAIAGETQALVEIEPQLRRLAVPTLIIWGTADTFFELSWAYWLRDTIAGATEVVEVEGGKLFFPDERAGELVPHLRRHWSAYGVKSESTTGC